MASPTRWTWVWVNSGSWWWTGRPGVLQFMGSQRIRHDWVTKLNWTEGLNQTSESPVKHLEQCMENSTEGQPLWCYCHCYMIILGYQAPYVSYRWPWNWFKSDEAQHWEHPFLIQSSCSVVSDFLRPHEPQHARPPCPSPTPRVYPNSCPSSQWCHPTISSSVVPLSRLRGLF